MTLSSSPCINMIKNERHRVGYTHLLQIIKIAKGTTAYIGLFTTQIFPSELCLN